MSWHSTFSSYIVIMNKDSPYERDIGCLYNIISDYSKVYVKENYYILNSSKFALHLGLGTLKHEHILKIKF